MPKLLLNKYLFVGLFTVCLFKGFSQKSPNWNILYKHQVTDNRFNERHVTYLFSDKKNVFVKYNPVSLLFGGSLYFYQKYISKQLMGGCPYELSCSTFSKAVIRRYGLLKGIPLTADRLTRCTRIASMDMDYYHFNLSTGKIIDSVETYQHVR